MTIVEPLPDLQWGKGTWQDYISNWRTRDTNWMQERLILRYQTTAARAADWPAPQGGHVTFNAETGLLEMWHPTKAAWVRSLMFQYLLSNKDDATGVSLFHASSGAKGVQLTPTSLLIDAPTTNFLNGVHTVDATGMTLKTGAKTAKLTTSATDLVSDSPITAPSLTTTAGMTATTLNATTSITSPLATLTSINMSGTLTGGVLNGASGTIGGVLLGSNTVQPPSGAGGGMYSGQAQFYGDGASAIMRQRASLAGAQSAAYVQATSDRVNIGGSASNYLDVYPTMRYFGGKGIHWINAGGTHQAWISPVIHQASDPGATNFPDGTIWTS